MNAPSARGLFRATGKKSKPVPVKLLDGTYSKIGYSDSSVEVGS